jgi:hypothetical protein
MAASIKIIRRYKMKLSIKSLTITAALLWGGGVFFVGALNLAVPSYGTVFLQCVSSVYPGFQNSRSFVDVLVGTCYALFDGAAGGAIFAWMYNYFCKGAQSA